MFYRKLRVIFLFLLIYFIPVPIASAKENFHTTYNITYNLTNSSESQAIFDITLTNNTTQYFASSYKMQFGFSDMRNIIIKDGSTTITPKTTLKEDGTQLDINFKNKVVGLNKQRHFILTFNTKEIVQNDGIIWEVNIPGAQKYSSIDDYNVVVNFPQDMGKFSYIKPVLGNLEYDGKTLKLLHSQIRDTGLSIAFGDEQIYVFKLSYQLENNNLLPVTKTIAIPPSTSYQDIAIENMNPRPQNVSKDPDGNWIATYLIPGTKKTNVIVEGKVRVLLKPKVQKLSNYEIESYLEPKQYWEVNDPEIIKLAKELKTPQNIYRYVVSNLTYDFSRVKNNQDRLGAKSVLNDSSSASCWEFTDLYIALSRAAGIPAREVNGFAYTKNSKERPLSLVQDVLHAWPEYYDQKNKTWIQIDPTWENTTGGIDYFNTFDFDHIAFVIQGKSSTAPIPAGGYKNSSDLANKDIHVTPNEDFPIQITDLGVSANLNQTFISGFPIEGIIEIFNTGNSISKATSVLISNEKYSFLQNLKINEIPPFGHEDLDIDIGSSNFLTKEQDTIKIQLGNKIYYQVFYVIPIFFNKNLYIGGVIFGIFAIGLFIGIKRSRRLSSKK
jgi:hypothetical protein